MIKYSVATQWDTEEIMNIIDLFDEYNILGDIYGAMTFCPIGHGRSPYAVPLVGLEQAREHISAIQEKGITFNYLLNGNFDPNKLRNKDFLEEVLEYLRTIFVDLNINFVTVAVPELVSIINQYYPNVYIKLSTINNIETVEDIEKYDDLVFHKVTLGNDAPRNIEKLKELKQYLDDKNIETEIMLTETCILGCKQRSRHYRKQTEKCSDFKTDWYMNNCTASRLIKPEEIFKSAWIRPEDLDYYVKDIGITNFKISGRSKTPEWTKRCLKAYINRKYNGNLMDILGTTPPSFENNSEHLFFIDNLKLGSFLINHPKKCKSMDCSHCNYCKNYAIELFKTGAFKINKICGEYSIKNGEFHCENGRYLDNLINLVNMKEGL